MKKIIYSIITIITLAMFLLNPLTILSTNAQTPLSAEKQGTLEVLGLVEQPLNLALSELASMPQTTVEATIYCVDFPNQVVETGNWTGVKLGFLLETAGILSSATKVAFFASDGYSTDLLLETAMQPNIIVAYEKDGSSLNVGLRLVVPGRWGYKWISQLTKIEVVDFDFKGKWESVGYSDDGIGRSSTSVITDLPSLNRSQPNSTIVSPSTPTPSPFISSNTSTSKEIQDPILETPEPTPQKQESFSYTSITIVSLVSVAIAIVTLLVYFKKRSLPLS